MILTQRGIQIQVEKELLGPGINNPKHKNRFKIKIMVRNSKNIVNNKEIQIKVNKNYYLLNNYCNILNLLKY